MINREKLQGRWVGELEEIKWKFMMQQVKENQEDKKMGNKICFKKKTRERQDGVFAHWVGAGGRGWTTVQPEGSVFSTSS